jgi:hypothetical protein
MHNARHFVIQHSSGMFNLTAIQHKDAYIQVRTDQLVLHSSRRANDAKIKRLLFRRVVMAET